MANSKPGMVEVALLKPHRHKGIEHRPGAKITVTKKQAERLARREVV